MEEFLTVSELAEKLKVPKSWVYGYSRQTGSGAMPRIKSEKYLCFRVDEMMDWIEKRQD